MYIYTPSTSQQQGFRSDARYTPLSGHWHFILITRSNHGKTILYSDKCLLLEKAMTMC